MEIFAVQMLNLYFFFECPILHQEFDEANINKFSNYHLGPFSHTHWKYISKTHCLFLSYVGHMYISEKGDLPHYQVVFSKFVLALKA
jgi:hypothetical protein